MRVALLRWRFSREWQRPEDSLDCRGLDLGKDQDKRLLFGQACDRLWIDCVRRALTRAAINPWSLNAASSYRYNRFHDVIAGGEGALLSLDADCWNLLIWDGAGRIRRVVTRLRDNTLAQDEMKIIADEAERALLSYAGSRVGKLYLAGSESEMAALAMMPGSHFHEKALLLHADTGLSGSIAGIKEGMAPLALAAALNI